MIWVVAALVGVVILLGVVILAKRVPRQESGVVSFRRHIDALSPEARREVMDRVRRPNDEDNDGTDRNDRNEGLGG